jgi:hypothetical protein
MRAQFSSSVTASPPAGPQAFDALIALAIIALGMSAWSNTRGAAPTVRSAPMGASRDVGVQALHLHGLQRPMHKFPKARGNCK